jgi:hypothetical protein
MRPAAWYYASTNTVSQSCPIPSSIVSESASVPCSQSKRAVVMSLRRWKSFFPAFAAIDTAIETATGARSRDKFRQLRSELVEMLCDAADDDVDRVKGLCRLLDSAMAEALLTLHVVPVTTTMLTTTGVDKAVEGLLSHEDGKVRALARDILIKWAQGGVLDTTVLAAPPSTPRMRPQAQRPETAILLADTPKISDEKMPPVVSNAGGDRVRSGQTGDAKRKHPGYYREADADDEKRQRNVSEKVEDRPRKMEPDIKSRSSWRSRDTKSRSRASSWRYRDERRFSSSTRHSHRRV